MEKDRITLGELTNDGQTIHLYYDAMTGVYLAFGLSAFYTTMLTEPGQSYSDEMQMPVTLLHQEHIQALKQNLRMIKHQETQYYLFKMDTAIGETGYDSWAYQLRLQQSGGSHGEKNV